MVSYMDSKNRVVVKMSESEAADLLKLLERSWGGLNNTTSDFCTALKRELDK